MRWWRLFGIVHGKLCFFWPALRDWYSLRRLYSFNDHPRLLDLDDHFDHPCSVRWSLSLGFLSVVWWRVCLGADGVLQSWLPLLLLRPSHTRGCVFRGRHSLYLDNHPRTCRSRLRRSVRVVLGSAVVAVVSDVRFLHEWFAISVLLRAAVTGR